MASDLRVISAEIITLDHLQKFDREVDKIVEIINVPSLKVKFSDNSYEFYHLYNVSRIDKSALETLQKRLQFYEHLIFKKNTLLEKYKKSTPTLMHKIRSKLLLINHLEYDIPMYESLSLKLKAVLNYIEEEITRDRKSFMEVIKTPCKPGSTLKGLPIVMMREIMSYL